MAWSITRGLHFFAGRTRVLLHDMITNTSKQVQRRMHTNATVNGLMTTLTIDDKKMYVDVLDAPSGVPVFQPNGTHKTTLPASVTDQPNPGVTVLAITLQPGTYNSQVLCDLTWSGQDAVDKSR